MKLHFNDIPTAPVERIFYHEIQASYPYFLQLTLLSTLFSLPPICLMVQPEDKGKLISYSQFLLLEVPKNYLTFGLVLFALYILRHCWTVWSSHQFLRQLFIWWIIVFQWRAIRRCSIDLGVPSAWRMVGWSNLHLQIMLFPWCLAHLSF